MSLPNSFYVKVAAASFALGAFMEFFMIKTGFYDVVTRNEAERWEENRVDREEKARVLREQLIHEFESKGLPVPEVLQQHPSRR